MTPNDDKIIIQAKPEIPAVPETPDVQVNPANPEKTASPDTPAKPVAEGEGVYTDTQGRPQFMPETVEEQDATYGSGENKTLEDLVKQEAKEDEEVPASSFSLNRTLGGVILARAIQRQIWLVMLITLFLIIYINNRYMCQKQTVEIDRLEKKLTETRYKATVCTSILTEKSRESNIINMLEAKGDSTLTIPSEPPYLIRVK